MADEAAKDAALDGVLQVVKLPRGDMKASMKKKVALKWNGEWNSIPPPDNKLRRIKESVKPFAISKFKDRHWERCLCRLRIGHSHLTHKHLIEREPPPVCDCGGIVTIYHLIMECHLKSNQRTAAGLQGKTFKDILTFHCQLNGPLHVFLKLCNIVNSI